MMSVCRVMCVGGREGVARGVALGMSSGMSRWVRGRQSQAGVVSPLAVRPSTRRVDRSVGAGALPALASLSTTASLPTEAISGLADGLELPVQLIYLMTLLGFLSFGAIVVVREVLSKRGMDEMAKEIGERVRMQEASAGDYYELGVILLRKKLFTQANQNLKKALKAWREGEGGEGGEEGEGEEAREELLAQVHNALGYSYFNLDRYEEAIKQYKTAVEMQPGYLTAWNNLGDVLEKQKKYSEALAAYQEVLGLEPGNVVAKERASWCRTRVERSGGLL